MVIHVDLGGSRPPRRPSWFVYVPGGLMILLGILILALPNLLQVLVAGTCILIGIALLAVPLGMRGIQFRPPGPGPQ